MSQREMIGAPTLLFVPGAFHGPWVWREVVDKLAVPGWKSQTVELPSTAACGQPRFTMSDDVAVVRRTLASSSRVVVGAHSYGGLVVPQAAAGLPNVRHIVYLAAFQLDVGQS